MHLAEKAQKNAAIWPTFPKKATRRTLVSTVWIDFPVTERLLHLLIAPGLFLSIGNPNDHSPFLALQDFPPFAGGGIVHKYGFTPFLALVANELVALFFHLRLLSAF
jgi:hypothetical protein